MVAINKGDKYSNLTVIEEVQHEVDKNGYRIRKVKCLCVCGNEVIVRLSFIRKKMNVSCGCKMYRAGIDNGMYKHGMTKSKLYKRWSNMKNRCFDENSTFYKDYGGRGIIVCNEWANSFSCFLDWANSNGYDEKLELDRRDNEGNYEPSNCRWVTKKENCNNRRSSVFFHFNGEKLTLTQIARKQGISRDKVYARVKHYGMSIEVALQDVDLRLNGVNKSVKYKERYDKH